MVRPGAVNPAEVKSYDLLVIGSPTHRGRPTDAVKDLMDAITPTTLNGHKVATFDTRFTTRWVRTFGFAAPRMYKYFKARGVTVVGAPGDFYVEGTKCPLKDGELERAAAWVRTLVQEKAQ